MVTDRFACEGTLSGSGRTWFQKVEETERERESCRYSLNIPRANNVRRRAGLGGAVVSGLREPMDPLLGPESGTLSCQGTEFSRARARNQVL